MRLQRKLLTITALLLCAIVIGAGVAMAHRDHRGQQDQRPEPSGFLKRAISEAGAPALTSDQETQLSTLFANFRQARPEGPDEELKAAHTAYNNAILAGDLEAAQAQATIIANRTAELSKTRMQAAAKLQIDVLAVLKSGGQLDKLKEKFGDRLVEMLGPMGGGPPFGVGRPGGEPGFRRGGGPGFRPGQRPERTGLN
jgi:Spy/CpxP family protein refolding chaperone